MLVLLTLMQQGSMVVAQQHGGGAAAWHGHMSLLAISWDLTTGCMH